MNDDIGRILAAERAEETETPSNRSDRGYVSDMLGPDQRLFFEVKGKGRYSFGKDNFELTAAVLEYLRFQLPLAETNDRLSVPDSVDPTSLRELGIIESVQGYEDSLHFLVREPGVRRRREVKVGFVGIDLPSVMDDGYDSGVNTSNMYPALR
jgi:hypothetical protein